MPDEFTRMRAAFIIGGEPGPSGQGYIDPSAGDVTSRRVKDVWAKPDETLTGLPEIGRQYLPGEEIQLAQQLNPFTDRSWDLDHYLDSEQVPALSVGVDWHPDYAQADEGAILEDLVALEASFQNYDPTKPTFIQVKEQRTSQSVF